MQTTNMDLVNEPTPRIKAEYKTEFGPRIQIEFADQDAYLLPRSRVDVGLNIESAAYLHTILGDALDQHFSDQPVTIERATEEVSDG